LQVIAELLLEKSEHGFCVRHRMRIAKHVTRPLKNDLANIRDPIQHLPCRSFADQGVMLRRMISVGTSILSSRSR
jgi:hypothetical protein